MSDTNQVRINELARELEVKAKAIIDLLPGFGVTEKKTHSSSISVEVAEKVRHALQGTAESAPTVAVQEPAKPAAKLPAPTAAPPAPVVPKPTAPAAPAAPAPAAVAPA
ncbi:MAG: translation initiation factor IF-2 N-terminal domain-containing protein, partial [Candidatus Acidiferrum sp.]